MSSCKLCSLFAHVQNCDNHVFRNRLPELVASLAFLKPNNSNFASFYSVWLEKISFGLKLFSGFF